MARERGVDMNSLKWAIIKGPTQTVWLEVMILYSVVMTQLSSPSCCLLLAETCSSHNFTSNQAATLSAQSPLSLDIKQEHVESDYTLGTWLCPPQSDDGDDWSWIFTAPAVNILACQSCISVMPTPVQLCVWNTDPGLDHITLLLPFLLFVLSLINRMNKLSIKW